MLDHCGEMSQLTMEDGDKNRVSQCEDGTDAIRRAKMIKKLEELAVLLNSSHPDVVSALMYDEKLLPFLTIFSRFPDRFLCDLTSLRLNVSMDKDLLGLKCQLYTANRELVKEDNNPEAG